MTPGTAQANGPVAVHHRFEIPYMVRARAADHPGEGHPEVAVGAGEGYFLSMIRGFGRLVGRWVN